MRICLLMIAASLLTFPQSANREKSQKIIFESPVAGDDISKAIITLDRAGASPKSEFETSAAFQTRIANIPEDLKKSMIFPLALATSQKFAYNADDGLMRVNVFVEYQFISNEPLRVLLLRQLIETYPPHVTPNTFGVTKPISRGLMEQKGIAIQQVQLIGRGLTFPIEAARARAVKPFLWVAFGGFIARALVYSLIEHHNPTMAEPADYTILREYVPFTAREILAIDSRDGSIVATIPIQ